MDLEPCKYNNNNIDFCELYSIKCTSSFDCYYKQLKRAKKENEELKMRCNFLMETLKAQGERKIDR